jgi:hypothetical protein
VQHVEPGKRQAAAAGLLHGGLVLAAPGIRETRPVAAPAERAEDALRLARNAGAPVDEGPEHVEEKSFDPRSHPASVSQQGQGRKPKVGTKPS